MSKPSMSKPSMSKPPMSKSSKTVSRRTAVGFSLAAAGASITSPALAQSQPALKWRMVTGYPKSLDTLDCGCPLVAKDRA